MSTVKVAKFSAVEYIAKNMRKADFVEIMATRFNEDPSSLAHEIVQAPFCWVAYYNNTPTCVFGVIEHWPGVWSVFLFATDEFDNVGRTVAKFCAQNLVPTVKNLGAHRVQAMSHTEHPKAHEFLVKMGAHPEASFKRYGKNLEDFVCFTWLDDENMLNKIRRRSCA